MTSDPADTARLRRADAHSNTAAAVLSLTLPGDVLLYLMLPLHAATFGVSLPEAGILLAANRIVRIVGYGWISRYFQRHGPRRSCFIAVIGAAVSTLGYALCTGLVALLLARLLWGLSFAALNISTQVLATSEATGAARRNGRSRAIISVGPMVALIAGALLSYGMGPQMVFAILAGCAVAALPLCSRLPSGPGSAIGGGPRMSLPTRLDVWSFMHGFTLDGLFIMGLSVLAAAALPHSAAIAAGTAMSLRYLSEIALSPAGGRIADHVGASRVLVALSILTALGMVAMGAGLLWTGAVAVVLLRGLMQPLPAPVAAEQNPGNGRVAAIARLATWRDLGAGIGPLVAGVVLPVLPPWIIYTVAALLLAGTALAIRRRK